MICIEIHLGPRFERTIVRFSPPNRLAPTRILCVDRAVANRSVSVRSHGPMAAFGSKLVRRRQVGARWRPECFCYFWRGKGLGFGEDRYASQAFIQRLSGSLCKDVGVAGVDLATMVHVRLFLDGGLRRPL